MKASSDEQVFILNFVKELARNLRKNDRCGQYVSGGRDTCGRKATHAVFCAAPGNFAASCREHAKPPHNCGIDDKPFYTVTLNRLRKLVAA